MSALLGAMIAAAVVGILELAGVDVSFALALLIGVLMGLVVLLIEVTR